MNVLTDSQAFLVPKFVAGGFPDVTSTNDSAENVPATTLKQLDWGGGRTAHHISIHPHSLRADLIRNAIAIIWDELPAMNRAGWESVDKLFADWEIFGKQAPLPAEQERQPLSQHNLPGDFHSLKEAEQTRLNAPEYTLDYLVMLTHPGKWD
ncbi:hypothetical protein DFJ58DRAFT_845284 [Suillus subalutaceus]|uniref:uncharacterized protein n=1 Tax=Suillus subalutaceus TaxID=48586 RepID=UPI001B88305E|nr:uncharacterized protein DFJ58DRAFT_845284 [Suillus subalutaceus]KAG1840560.1 hypothetical protein DFJ58DRAFT_845284 [Suillus subalutaceus]